MKRIAVALLPAAMLSATASFAQDDSVIELYGRLNVDVQSYENTGATAAVPVDRPTQVPASAYTGVDRPRIGAVTSNGSSFGVRGSERLNQHLTAWFQVESGVPVDAGNGAFASRNTAVGMRGKWGTMLIGQWDTPYKLLLARPLGFFRAVTDADYTDVIGNPGFGVPVGTTRFGADGSAADASFDRRQGNSIHYWAPPVAGVQARFGYSVAEGKTGGAVPLSPDIVSLSVEKSFGKLVLGYAYEQHNDYFGLKSMGGAASGAANRSSKDIGHRFLAIYAFGDTTLSGTFERLEYSNADATAGNVNNYTRDAFFVAVAQKLGRSELWLSYGRADDGECERTGGGVCNTHNLGAQMWTLAAKYNFTRRTFLYAFYTLVQNEASSRYSVAYLPVPAVGSKTTMFALGLNHDF
jgi:predicted porin